MLGTDPVTLIDVSTGGVTVSVAVADCDEQAPATVQAAVIVVCPATSPVATPLDDTVAIVVAEEDQVASALRSCCELSE
jgi:hypothetical protein